MVENPDINASRGILADNDWRKEYDTIDSFIGGRARVQKGGKYGHVDLEGRVTTPLEYDDIWSFREGRAMVGKDEKEGHVDLEGKVEWDNLGTTKNG